VPDGQTAKAARELSDTVIVHGIRYAERAISLIYSMAEIPCYPSLIFRINQQGNLIGAMDQLYEPARIYYIRVLNWNRRKGQRPIIAWTLRPQDISCKLNANMRRIVGMYNSRLRGRPPTVRVSAQEHATLYAKMVLGAS
jgi:hypothetical protein